MLLFVPVILLKGRSPVLAKREGEDDPTTAEKRHPTRQITAGSFPSHGNIPPYL